MAGGGYRGILAAVPPAQRLRSASGKGATDLKPKQQQQQQQQQQQRQDQKIAASLRSTAPTGKCVHLTLGRPVGRLAFAFAVYGPSRDRSEGMPSLGEAPNERGKNPLVTLGFFSKVTRCKSETISRRYQTNGYAPQPKKQKKRPPQPDVAATRG
jgi:hypothetical protein